MKLQNLDEIRGREVPPRDTPKGQVFPINSQAKGPRMDSALESGPVDDPN